MLHSPLIPAGMLFFDGGAAHNRIPKSVRTVTPGIGRITNAVLYAATNNSAPFAEIARGNNRRGAGNGSDAASLGRITNSTLLIPQN